MTKTQGDGEFSGFNEFLCDAMTKRHYFPQFSVSTDRLDYYQLYASRSLAFTISDKLDLDFSDQDFPVLTTGLSY